MKNSIGSFNGCAVGNGADGRLPTWAHKSDSKIVPLGIELRHIRLSCGSGSDRVHRLHRMLDWFMESLNPSKFP